MNTAGLLYGESTEVASYLGAKNNVTLDDVVPALVNALNRIATLESRLEKNEAVARKAACEASCLANGIIPD